MSQTPTQAMTVPGTLCWHELNSPKQTKSEAFYTALLGWISTDMSMGPMTYKMLMKEETPIAGIMDTSGPEWKDVPPHWMTYIAVKDIEASVRRVSELGGSVCVPPTEIPDVGRFSVITDPTGGTVSLIQLKQEIPLSNAFAWNEIISTDQAKAVEFYTRLIGWTTTDMNMGEGKGVYKVFLHDGAPMAGCAQLAPEMGSRTSHWMPFIGVSDIHASLEKAKKLGAKPIQPVTEVSKEIGHCAVIKDPIGAEVSLYQPADASHG